jgi:hypothetical protein
LAGEILKKRREDLGLTIEEVADALKIRTEFLVSIENDSFEKLPVSVYTMGYIRCYAKHLDIDAGEIVEHYKRHMVLPKTGAVFPVAFSQKKSPKSFYVLLVLLVSAGAFSLFYYSPWPTGNLKSPERVSQAPPPVQTVQVSPEPAQPEKALSDDLQGDIYREEVIQTAEHPEDTFVPSAASHHLVLTASDITWVRIRFSEGETKEILFHSGEEKTWDFPDSATLKIGNAGGIRLHLDGKDLGVPGKTGEVITLSLPQAKTED